MESKKLPDFLQSALYSYDLSEMDADNPADRVLIINQVLNRGTDKQVKWVLGYYTAGEIRQALEEPLRGSWWPESLNYWSQVLKIFVFHPKSMNEPSKISTHKPKYLEILGTKRLRVFESLGFTRDLDLYLAGGGPRWPSILNSLGKRLKSLSERRLFLTSEVF